MTPTEWHVTVTTFAGETLGDRNGHGVDRATAITELFESARDHVVERDHNILPVYTLNLDGQMIGFVATGQTPDRLHPDLEGVVHQLRMVEIAARTVVSEQGELIRRP